MAIDMVNSLLSTMLLCITKLNFVPVSRAAMLRRSKLHKIDVFRREAHKIQKFYAGKCKKYTFL